MLQYIQQHIHQPELLRAESLSKIFHLSPDYIGIYFKRYYQETLQQYIGRNRLKDGRKFVIEQFHDSQRDSL